MSPKVSERSFEEAIKCGLVRFGPDAWAHESDAVRETHPPFGESPPRGYYLRSPSEYDRAMKWKGRERNPDGDFNLRVGRGTVKLPPDRAARHLRTRFPKTS